MDPKIAQQLRWPVFIAAIVDGIVIALASIYAVFAILGYVDASVPIFLSWLAALNFFNGISIYLFWRVRRHFGFSARAFMLLWAGLSLWYWTVAPLYYLLTMNVNVAQLAWVMFAYFWEVPGVGGGLFVLGAMYYLRPLSRYMDGRERAADYNWLYRRSITAPPLIGALLFVVVVLGYAIGAWQMRFFADMPLVEQAKNVLNGVATSIFLGVVYYLLFEKMLNAVRGKLEDESAPRSVLSRKFSREAFWVTLFTALGGILLLLLVGIQSFQIITSANVQELLRHNVREVSESRDFLGKEEIAERLREGDRGQVFFVGMGEALPFLPIATETATFIAEHGEGTVRDVVRDIRVISFFIDSATGEKIFSVAYEADFYGLVKEVIMLIYAGIGLVLVLSVVAIFYISTTEAQAVAILARKVNIVSKEGRLQDLDPHTGDETEELAHALIRYATESRELRKTLEEKVASKTGELAKKIYELEESKKAILNILEDLEREKDKIEAARTEGEAVLESVGDGLIIADRYGKIKNINKAALELLGFGREELVDRRVMDALTIYDSRQKPIAAEARPIIEAIITGKVQRGDYYYQKKSGEKLPVALTAAPLLVGGNPIGCALVFRDVTREREIDRAKTEFVSLASHQLRTPVSIVNWYAEMLLAGDLGDMPEKQKKYLEEIYAANQRMNELINALLNVSRIEMGTFVVEPVPVNLAELIKEVVKEVEPKVFERKLDLREHYGKNIPTIILDKGLMHIVIDNLLSNAIKYTPSEGRVDIRIEPENNSVLISVKDTGYGIPEKQKSRIFEKLFRADNVKIKDTTGTGLGLYLVKNIVEYAHGKVWFESEEGKGSTFYVSIPISGMRPKEGMRVLEETK